MDPRENEVTVCEPASVNATPSYLREKKNPTQSLGPTVGRSIASFLCTQDLTLFREAWQRKESWPLMPPAVTLAPLQLLTSAVVTVFVQTQSQGAA